MEDLGAVALPRRGGGSARHDVYMSVISKDVLGLQRVFQTASVSCDFVIKGKHILTHAAERADRDVVKVLLDWGAPWQLEGSEEHLYPTTEMPVMVAIRLNKRAVFDELVSRGRPVPVAPCVPWACVVERRYGMLEQLLGMRGQRRKGADAGAGEAFLVEVAAAGSAEQGEGLKFLSRYLDVLVGADVDLSHWVATTRPSLRGEGDRALVTGQRGLSLLIAAGCRVHLEAPPRLLPNSRMPLLLRHPHSLLSLARVSLRRHLVGMKRYAYLTRLCHWGGQRDVEGRDQQRGVAGHSCGPRSDALGKLSLSRAFSRKNDVACQSGKFYGHFGHDKVTYQGTARNQDSEVDQGQDSCRVRGEDKHQCEDQGQDSCRVRGEDKHQCEDQGQDSCRVRGEEKHQCEDQGQDSCRVRGEDEQQCEDRNEDWLARCLGLPPRLLQYLFLTREKAEFRLCRLVDQPEFEVRWVRQG